MFAVTELVLILNDAWQAAGVVGRLRVWWWVITHRKLFGVNDVRRTGDATALILILSDAWQAADVVGRLRAWWWVITHRKLLGVSGAWQVKGDDTASA